jgi:hypothetical protein
MLNKMNEPDDTIKTMVIDKWVLEEGMSPDGAELKWDIVYKDIVLMETPDRYSISEVPETYDALVAMLDFASSVQEYTIKLMYNKRFKKKIKHIKNKHTMVKHVINEMRSRNTRFTRKSWLKYTGDVWLQDTIQYAITNVALKNNGHINETELFKRSFATIFRQHKSSPLCMDYSNGTITLPNIDGVGKINVNIKDLEQRSILRNIRLIHGDGDRLMLCVHHKDHGDKEHIERQRLIAKRAGIDLDAMDAWVQESTMQPKNDLEDLFSTAAATSVC